MTGPRFDGAAHTQIYTWVQQGPAGSGAADAQAVWTTAEQRLVEIDGLLAGALRDLDAGWEGAGADAARRGLTPVGAWAADAAGKARTVAVALQDQSAQAAWLRSAVPVPSANPVSEQPPVSLNDPGIDPYNQADWAAAAGPQREAAQRAVDVMNKYSDDSLRALMSYEFADPPPAVTVETSAPTASGGGRVDAGSGYERAAGTAPVRTGAAGVLPAPGPGPAPSGAAGPVPAPSGPGGVLQAPGPGGLTPVAPGSVGGPPGAAFPPMPTPTGVPPSPVVPVAAGRPAGPGGRRPSTIDPLPAAGASGPGRSTGISPPWGGMPGGTTAVPPSELWRNRAADAAARPGNAPGAPMPGRGGGAEPQRGSGGGPLPGTAARGPGSGSTGHSGMVPMGAGAGGVGGGGTRPRPGYLIDDSDAFVVTLPCTRPVINEDDPEHR